MLIFKRIGLMFLLGFFVHKIFFLIVPMGEFINLSFDESIAWFLNKSDLIIFLIYFLCLLLIVSFRIFKIKLVYSLLWAIAISLYVTMFELPGYYMNYITSKFENWADIISLTGLIILSLIIVLTSPTKKRHSPICKHV